MRRSRKYCILAREFGSEVKISLLKRRKNSDEIIKIMSLKLRKGVSKKRREYA